METGEGGSLLARPEQVTPAWPTAVRRRSGGLGRRSVAAAGGRHRATAARGCDRVCGSERCGGRGSGGAERRPRREVTR
jgi:hypothetical protein